MTTIPLTQAQIDNFAKPIFDRISAQTYQKELPIPDVKRVLVEFFSNLGKPVPNDQDIAYLFQLYDHDFSGKLNWLEFQDLLKVIGGLQDSSRQRIMNNKPYWKQPGGLYP